MTSLFKKNVSVTLEDSEDGTPNAYIFTSRVLRSSEAETEGTDHWVHLCFTILQLGLFWGDSNLSSGGLVILSGQSNVGRPVGGASCSHKASRWPQRLSVKVAGVVAIRSHENR